MRDLRFSGIAILRNQITGKPRQMIIGYVPLTALSQFDHFAGAGKMIIGLVTGLPARYFRPLNRVLESPPLTVAQQRLQLPRTPKFGAMFVALFELLERFSFGL